MQWHGCKRNYRRSGWAIGSEVVHKRFAGKRLTFNAKTVWGVSSVPGQLRCVPPPPPFCALLGWGP